MAHRRPSLKHIYLPLPHVGVAFLELVAVIEVVAVATFKICAKVTVVEISSQEEWLLHCQGLAEH